MSEPIGDPTLSCSTCQSTRWILSVPTLGPQANELVVTCAHGHLLDNTLEPGTSMWVEMKPL